MRRHRWAVSVVFLVHGLVVAAWVARLPEIQRRHALSPGDLGLVLLAIPAASLVAMPVAGALTHARGTRPVVMASTLAFCASLPMIGFAPNVLLLVAALMWYGAAAGIMDVAMNAQAVEVEHEYGRPVMASFHALFSSGGMAGAALGGLAAGAGIPASSYLLAASAGFACAGAAVFRMLPSTHAEPGAPFRFVWTREVLALGGLSVCVLAGEGAMADWTAIFLRDVLSTGAGTAAVGYAVFSGFMAAGRFTGDRATAALGRRRLARAGTLTAAAGLTLAGLAPVVGAALLGFAMVGAGYAVIVPLVYVAAARLPNTAPGPGIAAISTLGYTGFLAGPPLVGFTAEAASLRASFLLLAALALCAALLAGYVEPRGSGLRHNGRGNHP